MSKPLQIAKTIKSQISNNELMAIGARGFVAMNESHNAAGGLRFSASLFGRSNMLVQIELKWNDTYTVTHATRAGRTISVRSDVYCDDLEAVVVDGCEKHFGTMAS